MHEGGITITKRPITADQRHLYVAGDRWIFTRIGGQEITAARTRHTAMYEYQGGEEVRYGERELLAHLIADVEDLDHPMTDAIRPNWGGEPGSIAAVAEAFPLSPPTNAGAQDGLDVA